MMKNLKSWNCKNCTNKCLMFFDNDIRTYCRVIYDQPDNKGIKWFDDELVCLDYTENPNMFIKEIRLWFKPPYKVKEYEN